MDLRCLQLCGIPMRPFWRAHLAKLETEITNLLDCQEALENTKAASWIFELRAWKGILPKFGRSLAPQKNEGLRNSLEKAATPDTAIKNVANCLNGSAKLCALSLEEHLLQPYWPLPKQGIHREIQWNQKIHASASRQPLWAVVAGIAG